MGYFNRPARVVEVDVGDIIIVQIVLFVLAGMIMGDLQRHVPPKIRRTSAPVFGWTSHNIFISR